MNPLTNVKNINKINDIELAQGTVDKKSWHDIYRESAWIFIGGLAYGLTEGDVLSVFSQYGEIVNINLVRDKKTGKIKGFCFLCYANQKSTVLAVDNLNGIKLCGRTIRVDHVANYKPPKEHEDEDEITRQLKAEGCAPKPIKLETPSNSEDNKTEKKKSKKVKKEKKKHKKNKKKHSESSPPKIKIKEEKHDPGYEKYELPQNPSLSKERRPSSEDSDGSTDSDSSSAPRSVNQKSRTFRDIEREKNVKSSRNKVGETSRGIKRKSQSDSSSDSDEEYVRSRKSLNNSKHFERSRGNGKSTKSRNYSDSSPEERRTEKDNRTHYDSKHSSTSYRQRNGSSYSDKRSSKHHKDDSPYDSESDSQRRKSDSHVNKKCNKHYDYEDSRDTERKHHKRHDKYDEHRHHSNKKHGEVSKRYERESRKERR